MDVKLFVVSVFITLGILNTCNCRSASKRNRHRVHILASLTSPTATTAKIPDALPIIQPLTDNDGPMPSIAMATTQNVDDESHDGDLNDKLYVMIHKELRALSRAVSRIKRARQLRLRNAYKQWRRRHLDHRDRRVSSPLFVG